MTGRRRARLVRAVAATAICVTLAACSTGGSSGPATAGPSTVPPPDPTTAARPSASPAPSATGTDGASPPSDAATPGPATPAPDPATVRVRLASAGDGFSSPVHTLAFGGRTLVVEQVGRVTDLDSGAVWLDIGDRVRSGGEQGLLGVDVHPDGSHVVTHWSDGDGATVLATYVLDDDGRPDVGSESVVLRLDQPAANHNGGSAVFGPDGLLWLALGDGGGAGDPFGHGQEPGTLLGTLLRLDLDDPARAVVPQDNPFVSGGGRAEVWAYGLRNPYRIAFGAQQVYVADVGQDAVEEVTVLRLDEGGANLGWPLVEGDRCFREGCDLAAFEQADVTYTHDATDGCSVIGGMVYDGAALPGLRGHFLYGDLCGGILRTVRAEQGEVVAELDLTEQVGSVAGVTGIGTDADGEPLLTFGDGRVLRLVPAG